MSNTTIALNSEIVTCGLFPDMFNRVTTLSFILFKFFGQEHLYVSAERDHHSIIEVAQKLLERKEMFRNRRGSMLTIAMLQVLDAGEITATYLNNIGITKIRMEITGEAQLPYIYMLAQIGNKSKTILDYKKQRERTQEFFGGILGKTFEVKILNYVDFEKVLRESDKYEREKATEEIAHYVNNIGDESNGD